MAKDRKARQQIGITVIALANLIAAITDAMRNADIGNDIVHNFLDELDRLNDFALSGLPRHVLRDIVEIVRSSVPTND